MPPKKKDNLYNKIPPQNLDAEKAVLGCILISEEAKIQAFESVRPEFFYSEINKAVFLAVCELFEKNEKCDLVTLTNHLKKKNLLEYVGDVAYLTELVEMLPTAANIDEYIKIVKDKYLLRTIIDNATRIITEASGEPEEIDSFIDKAETSIFEISQHKSGKNVYALSELVKENVEKIEDIHNKRGFVTGISSGFVDLDKMTTGFHPADFIIVASRPSMGKTAFACNVALNMNSSVNKYPILIFSLEMSKEQLVHRMLCCEAKINLMKLRQGMLSDQDMGNLLLAAGMLEEMPVFIDDTPQLNVFEVRARARRLKASENIQMIIIDYLQLMKSRNRAENRQQEITEISASLKALAKELNVPVIAISQLSRATEQRENKEPFLSDLRESGSLEQDADLVLLLFREDFYRRDEEKSSDVANVIIAKQRNGPTGKIELTFLREYTRFENLSHRE
ncbi:MAG TPA: replicative DNA helicase [bacterium]|nr:replicative DNA helicase [bacterium]